MAIPITEEFNDDRGRLLYYDSYDAQEKSNINNLKHVDIRSFRPSINDGGVGDLNFLSMLELNGFTVNELQLGSFSSDGEAWTSGTTGPSGIDVFYGLSLPISNGITETSSVMGNPIDLLTDFDDDDFISISLPEYPASIIDPIQSYISLTSNPTGIFDDGSTSVNVFFSNSIIPLENGNSELRFRRDAFVNTDFDLSTIYGVKFSISSESSGTFNCLGIRLLGKGWKYGPVDLQTMDGTFRKTIPLNGDPASPYTRGNGILWRSTGTLATDPRPIDLEVGTVFNSGSFETDEECSISLYFRELTEDFLTQVDLDGYPQSFFDGKIQPDVGDAMFNPRMQTELDGLYQNNGIPGQQLDQRTQHDLERTPDFLSSSYAFSSIYWSGTRSLIQVGTSESSAGNGVGYPYSFPILEENTEYVLFSKIEDNSMRIRLYHIDEESGNALDLVFDTRSIIDSSLIKRWKGRFGWNINLPTSAYVDSIRSRGEVYAEYISSSFESDTSVIGSELFVQASPDEQLFQTLAPGIFNSPGSSSVSTDTSKSTSGQSYRINSNGNQSDQGFISNPFLIRDFDNITIDIDIYYPKSLIDTGLSPKFSIISQDNRRIGDLSTPKLFGDQWESLQFRLPFGEDMLSGLYRFSIVQPGFTPATWWIDMNVSIADAVISWSGRAIEEDPWKSNNPKWQPYNNIKNGSNFGIVFDERGRSLQTRARSFRPDGQINRIQTIPKYAELGKLIFDQDAYYSGTGATVDFPSPTELSTKVYNFIANTTFTTPATHIISYTWYFGDGEYGYGQEANHKYDTIGTYDVTLVVIDNHGNKSSITKVLIV